MAGETLPRVMHGARAQMMVGDKIVGIIDSVSYNVVYTTASAFILGRLSAASNQYVAAEIIHGNMHGWRVIEHGVYVDLALPKVQELLTAPYTHLAVLDRVTNKIVGHIRDVLLTGFTSGYTARQLSEVGVPFEGIMYSDESAENAESAGATQLP